MGQKSMKNQLRYCETLALLCPERLCFSPGCCTFLEPVGWIPERSMAGNRGFKHHLSSDKMAFTAPIRRSTLPKTSSSPMKIGRRKRKLVTSYSNHPFSGANCFFQGGYTPFQLAYPAYEMVTLPIYQWNLCFLQTELFSFKLTPKTLLYLPKTWQNPTFKNPEVSEATLTASGADPCPCPCLTGTSVHVTSGGELSAWWSGGHERKM